MIRSLSLAALVSLLAFPAPTVHADVAGSMNYALATSPRERVYHFFGWPRNSEKPVYFRSALHADERGMFVRLDDTKLLRADESKIRRPGDFDSLKASRVQPLFLAGVEYTLDGSWVKARAADERWAFPRTEGAITLFATRPGGESYVWMDTGAGLEPYSEEAVRDLMSGDPGAAKWLRRERRGHLITWGMALGGGILTATGIVTSVAGSDGGNGLRPNGLVFAGLGIAALSWLPHLMVEGDFERAVRAYNAGRAAASVPDSAATAE